MKNMFYDISGKIEAPFIDAILDLKKIAAELDIPFFLIGAMARDVLFEYLYDIKSPRGTLDVDLGVKISDWETFGKLSEALIATGKFTKTEQVQRFVHNSILVDIVPFGTIADEDLNVIWPPEHEIVMSTIGFEEVYDFSTTIRMSKSPELDVKVPIIPGIAIMKILSWHEKYPGRKKDAEDLLFMMEKYDAAGNFDRLYEDRASILKGEDHNVELASIRLLGRDMAKMASRKTLDKIKGILIEETSDGSQYSLASDMSRMNDDFDNVLLKIKKLKDGIMDI